MKDLQSIFGECRRLGAADIFVQESQPLRFKVDGEVVVLGTDLFSKSFVSEVVSQITTPTELEKFNSSSDLDGAVEDSRFGRFRFNICKSKGMTSIVFREVKGVPPTIDSLGVPAVLKDLAIKSKGLLLVVGPTGSGKTTTMAAMVDYINETCKKHILTIEDPIEYTHENKLSIVTQREVYRDTETFSTAIKSAMRQSPDVILMGEVRNKEGMEQALEFAETGHLCIATLHANSAKQSFNRILSMFPLDLRESLLMQMSMNLVGVISQKLIKGESSGRIPCVEVLINSSYISKLIMEGKLNEIGDIVGSSSDGMQTFDQHLFDICQSGGISEESAIHLADSPNNMRQRINSVGAKSGAGSYSLRDVEVDLD